MIPIRDLNPTRTFPFMTILLILANSAVFLYQLTLRPRALDTFIRTFAVVPFEISHGVDVPPLIGLPIYLTIVTAMFMHGGWLHIIGNMLYLWIFGNNIEDRFGHVRFLIIYLIWGVIAAFAQIVVDPESRVPALGASGAIAGVLGAYLIIFPNARVDTLLFIGFFITTVRLPALIVIGQWIVIQFLTGIASLGVANDAGGVAYFAHIGGAVAGLAIGIIYRLLNPRPPASYDYQWNR
jgi:rhomboid family protein